MVKEVPMDHVFLRDDKHGNIIDMECIIDPFAGKEMGTFALGQAD